MNRGQELNVGQALLCLTGKSETFKSGTGVPDLRLYPSERLHARGGEHRSGQFKNISIR